MFNKSWYRFEVISPSCFRRWERSSLWALMCICANCLRERESESERVSCTHQEPTASWPWAHSHLFNSVSWPGTSWFDCPWGTGSVLWKSSFILYIITLFSAPPPFQCSTFMLRKVNAEQQHKKMSRPNNIANINNCSFYLKGMWHSRGFRDVCLSWFQWDFRRSEEV